MALCDFFFLWLLFCCVCLLITFRRDSFITHRAFCDALAEESARAIAGTPNPPLLLPSQPGSSSTTHINLQTQFNPQDLHIFALKKEQQSLSLRPEIPPWLGPPTIDLSPSSSIFSQEFSQTHNRQDLSLHENPNPNPSLGPTLPAYQPVPSPHMSATALLQRAAQMGATMSKPGSSTAMIGTHQQAHVSANSSGNNDNNSNGDCGFNLSPREDQMKTSTGFGHGFAAFGNKAAMPTSGSAGTGGVATSGVPPSSSLFHDVMNSFSSPSGFEGTAFEDAFVGGILNSSKKDGNLHYTLPKTTTTSHLIASDGGGSGVGNEGLTRDFLGLRPLSHSDILSIAGIGNSMSDQNQTQKPWQG